MAIRRHQVRSNVLRRYLYRVGAPHVDRVRYRLYHLLPYHLLLRHRLLFLVNMPLMPVMNHRNHQTSILCHIPRIIPMIIILIPNLFTLINGRVLPHHMINGITTMNATIRHLNINRTKGNARRIILLILMFTRYLTSRT